MQDSISQFVRRIGETRSTVLAALCASAFFVVYGPLAVAAVFFDRYFHTIDTLMVLITAIVASVIPALLALSRVDFYVGSSGERTRENRAWAIIAVGALVIVIGRAIYAWEELLTPGTPDSIVLADVLFALSFLFILVGLLLIPWSSRRRPAGSSFVSATIVVVATGTLFWPIMIGPAVSAGMAGTLNLQSFANYLIGVAILMFTMLWIMMREVREDLWPTAIAFMISIGCMILIQIGLLAYLVRVEGDGHSLPLLVANGASSASLLAIALAAVLRVRALVSRSEQPGHARLVDDISPVPFWQMILPYPVLIMLVGIRFGMEGFDWRQEYRPGMVVGVGIIVILMMAWQIPMLRYNQKAFLRAANASIRDGLTGLFTHRALHDLLGSEVARSERTDSSLAVLFMDIDRFKRFNDSFGHQSGDQVIVSVSDILRENVRSSDFAGRYGGEEFMIIAPDITREDALQLAERLRRALAEQEFIFDGQRVTLTMSVGVALYPDDTDDPEDVIDMADEAMYEAKRDGRNRTVMYRQPVEGVVSA